ncbi:restriction endonuclease subunit S [Acinetobacter sp. UBA1297]|uniref:restriction endonuclease subunit S n=1 Tax=Acinetobacter sp. UBA1297 TaxID=1945925 RepID=UPI00257944BD|nr:restriction endonuclease subunit S [Acinetobacter sp. UBA1297]
MSNNQLIESNEFTYSPKLRFTEFRNTPEWTYKNGNEIFEAISNKNHNSDLPILAITQEYGAIPRDEIDYTVIVTDKSVEGYKVVDRGDFIISLRSFQGGIEYSRYKGICSPAYIILRKKDPSNIDLFYKYYLKTSIYIRQLNHRIEGLRDGKMVSYKQFSEILLPLPLPQEQAKISACIYSIDILIQNELSKLESYKQHRNGLLQELFPRDRENLPRLRLGEFSETWESVELSKIAKPIKKKNSAEDEIKVLSLSNEYGLVSQIDYFQKKIAGNNTDRYIVLEKNDFVYNDRITKNAIYGTIKRLSLYESGIVSPIYKCFRFEKNQDPVFWEYFFESKTHESEIKHIVNEGARAGRYNISIDKFLSINVMQPSLAEQEKIASCLTSLDHLISHQKNYIDQIKRHMKGLMQQLFPVVEEI